ncbi:MAG: alpha/beta hydrolase [Planctomycetota bacterium]|nr:MAG: alpha/beta hydrolase [Planctomycetota bacterium]
MKAESSGVWRPVCAIHPPIARRSACSVRKPRAPATARLVEREPCEESDMRRVRVGDIELAVEERGAGEPLLLVHGFPLTHAMWREQLAGLADVARLVAPDLRGFGQSDVTPGAVTMARFADDLAALLDALGVEQPVTYCGLSMGGYIGWEFWRRHRDRVARMILCDTRAAADSDEAKANRRNVAERVLAEGPRFLLQVPEDILRAARGESEEETADTPSRRRRALSQLMRKLFSPYTIEHRPEVIAFVRELILQNRPEGIAAASLGMAERDDATPLLPSIDVPALVVVGEDDGLSAVEEMRQIADAMPDAELVVIEKAGHMAPLENPGPVNEAIERFLRGRSRAS